MEIVDGLREAWSGVIGDLEALELSGWDRATPCEGWTVHDVAAHLGHLEGLAHGFTQPPTPEDFDPDRFEGFHRLTEEGVAARRILPHDAVLDEIRRASQLTVDQAAGRDEAAWSEPAPSPVGMVAAHQAADLRLADVYVHLLDIRQALGIDIDPNREPAASRLTVARALRLAGWGAVKQAGLPEGTRIGLAIDGSGADLVIEGGRGNLVPAAPDTDDRITGSGLAFLVAAAGRRGKIPGAGELEVAGEAARRFLSGYRLFL